MPRLRNMAALVLAAAVLGGGGYAGWTRLNPPETAAVNSAGGVISLNTSPTPEPAISDLRVTAANPNAAQGAVGPESSAGGGATPAPNAAKTAPGPADFKQYEQYKANATALYGDLLVGQGAEVVAGSTVTVAYKGWLTSGSLFDESAPGKPFSFKEGDHRVIAGWEQGIFGMKAGGRRRLIIPPSQGYGDQGQGSIPGGSVLVFDVEVLSVK